MISQKIHKYQGCIHIHTVKSDGTGDIDKITKAAQNAGLSWIIITDHNYIDCEEGFINNVLVIKGQEVSPQFENHYLVLGTNKLFLPDNDLQKEINDVRENGGFGFAAHPDEFEKRKNNNKPIKWLDKNIEPDGIEIWNMFSQWGDNYNSKNILTAAYSYFFRNNLIKKPYSETLDWWDKLNNKYEKIIPAIGGVDAHELIRKDFIIPLRIFPYEYSFKTLVNEILLKEELSKDFVKAKNQVLTAIKFGNNTILNKIRCKHSPEIRIENTKTTAYSGDTIELDNYTFVRINLNKSLNIVVFKNGLKYNSVRGKNFNFQLSESGKYRVEIEDNNLGYAYTNPITVY